MDEPQAAPRKRLQRKRRGCLLGCLITVLAALLIGGVAWWYIRGHLGELASGLVREQAAQSLNGRLEFSKLEIDLAGRAVLHDAEIYMDGESTPVFTCPKAIARFDPFNFIGPNRGRRAVEVTLQQPTATMVREPDGSFNLMRLAKEREEPSENQIGVSVQLRDARIMFTDWCLLDENYPQIPATSELARKLLDELGYHAGGPAEQIAHEETLRVDGSVVVNNERQELAFSLEAERDAPGGTLTVRGNAQLDGKTFDARIGVRELELSSLADYCAALFPKLSLELSTMEGGAAAPSAAGLISAANVHAVQASGEPLELAAEAELAGVRITSDNVPTISLPRIKASYDPDPQRVQGELAVQALGLDAEANGRYNIDEATLDATVKLASADLAQLLVAGGLKDAMASGTVSAEAVISGALKQPVVEAKLSSTALKFDKLALGKLRGTARLEQQVLALSGVELTGGDLPLRASGKLNMDTQSGELSATAGPLTVADALALARRFESSLKLPELEAAGKFQASASVTLTQGQPQTKLRVWSDELAVQGYKLQALDIAGQVQAPNINLEAAEATLILPQAIDAAGFTSDGPLQAALRVGGSVSMQPNGKPAVLALSGSGVTKNLVPAQATLSFKAVGPATAPELRAQLKTTHIEHPLVLSARATYHAQAHTPVSAKLTWFDTSVAFEGGVNQAKQTVSGKLTADKVDLARFAGEQGLSGEATLAADVGGTFQVPTLAGTLSAPRIAIAKDGRWFELTGASAGFKLAEGDSVSVSNGVFDFAGNHFTLGGTLGAAQGDLTIRSDPFNLFSVVSVVTSTTPPGAKTAPSRPPLQIDSQGVLVVKVSGKLDDPQASIDYSSPSGTVEGQHYTDARLLGTANKTQASISNFSIKSASGSINASAVVHYEPLAYQAGAQVNNFNLGVITPVIGIEMLQQLTGLLNGSLSVNGEAKRFTADGELSLAQGQFSGVALDQARAAFRTSGEALEITAASVKAQGTELTASGIVYPSLEQTRFTVNAPRLELALLNPFLPDSMPPLGGSVTLNASLAPGKGKYPEAQVKLSDAAGGVRVDGTQITGLDVQAALAGDKLTISQGKLLLADSQFELSGGIELGQERQVEGRASYPLDFALRTQNLDLGKLLAALPEEYTVGVPAGLGGALTCDVHLSGMSHDPQLQGSVDFDANLAQVEQAQAFGLSGVAGQIVFAQNEFKKLDIQLHAEEGSGLAAARITGSGELALNPLRLTPGSAIDIALAPPGEYTVLNASYPGAGSFNGSLAGTVHVRGTKQKDIMAEISGNVVFNAAEQKSKIFMKMPETSAEQERKPLPFRFGNRASKGTGLELTVKPGTEVEGPYDLRAQINGSVILSGRPGIKDGPDKFEINGTLDLPEGSLFVYRHTIRLDGNTSNYLSFRSGELFPYFTGRGALVLPNVLDTNDLGVAQTQAGLQTTQIGSGRDLTVYFNFNQVRLGNSQEAIMNEVRLSSQPALSVDKIEQYLLGGAAELMAGHGDFGDIAESELVGFGASFISREIERMFDLQAFRVGMGEGGSYYTYVEKDLTDDMSLTYYKDFFSQTGQKEQWGVKYQLYDISSGSRFENLTLNMNFTASGYTGTGSEFMFVWNTKF